MIRIRFFSALLLVALITLIQVSYGQESMTTNALVQKASAESQDTHKIIKTDRGALIHCPLQAIEGQLDKNGIRIVSSGPAANQGKFSLTPSYLKRGDTIKKIHTGYIKVQNDTAQLIRPELIEEFTTNANGIRQDFIIPTRLPGHSHLELTLKINGGQFANIKGKLAQITTNDGRKLSWHNLVVYDAENSIINSSFKHHSDGISIHVDDGNAKYPLRIDPTFSDSDWIGFGELGGTDGPVNAIIYYDNKLYFGGDFDFIDHIPVDSIVSWNGENWELPEFTSTISVKNVDCFHVHNEDLYIGGSFLLPGYKPDSAIKWDGHSAESVGLGIIGFINSITSHNNLVYFGGRFSEAGDNIKTNSVAVWNPQTETWSPLKSQIDTPGNRWVNKLYIHNNTLLIGGNFRSVADNTIPAKSIIGYNLNAPDDSTPWITFPNWPSIAGSVNDITVYQSSIIAVGKSNLFYKWNIDSPNGWETLGNELNTDDSSSHTTLTIYDNYLIASGDFYDSNNSDIRYLAKLNLDKEGSNWENLGSGLNGKAHNIYIHNDLLYLGGYFAITGNNSSRNIAIIKNPTSENNISFETISNNNSVGFNGAIRSILAANSQLYVGGDFTYLNNKEMNRIARWDGNTWHQLGKGLDNIVTKIIEKNGNIIVAGMFKFAGELEVNGIAMWKYSSGHPSGLWTLAADLIETRSQHVGGVSIKNIFTINNYLYIYGLTRIKNTSGQEFILARCDLSKSLENRYWTGLTLPLFKDKENRIIIPNSFYYDNRLFLYGNYQYVSDDRINSISYINLQNHNDNLICNNLGSGIINNHMAAHGPINDLCVLNDYVYVVGVFSEAGEKNAYYFARFNLKGSNDNSSWENMNIKNSTQFIFGYATMGIISHQNNLYLSARINRTDKHFTLLRFTPDKNQWVEMGTFKSKTGRHTLCIDDNKVYVGGDIMVAGSINTAYLAAYDLPSQQSITFDLPNNADYGINPINLEPKSNSSLPISLNVIQGPASIQNNQLNITGTGLITVEASQAGDDNHEAAEPIQAEITINKAKLNVTANSTSKLINSEKPELAYSISGFAYSEDESVIEGTPKLTTSATVNSPIGKYDIVVNVTGMSADNYTFTAVNGTLSIYELALRSFQIDGRINGGTNPFILVDNEAAIISEGTWQANGVLSETDNQEISVKVQGAESVSTTTIRIESTDIPLEGN